MVRYSLYTEDKGNIGKLTSEYFLGFTLFSGVGFYKGLPEKSIKIEVLLESSDDTKVEQLIDTIKGVNKQQSVLMIKEVVASELV